MGLLVNINDLNQPISLENPVGKYLRYTQVYDKIKQLRFQFDTTRDFQNLKNIEEICIVALKEETKDLQIIAYLLEAYVHLYDMQGLISGLQILNNATQTYWENIYPLMDDIELRLSPFIWLNEKFVQSLNFIQMTFPQYTDFKSYTWADIVDTYQFEKLLSSPQIDSQELMNIRIDEKRPYMAEFLKSIQNTPLEKFENLLNLSQVALTEIKDLENFLENKLHNQTPSFVRIKDLLNKFIETTQNNMRKKKTFESNLEKVSHESLVESHNIENTPSINFSEGIIDDREQAYETLNNIAEYLMKIEPHSPAPYLIQKAVQWGNMSINEILMDFTKQDASFTRMLNLLGLDGKNKK